MDINDAIAEALDAALPVPAAEAAEAEAPVEEQVDAAGTEVEEEDQGVEAAASDSDGDGEAVSEDEEGALELPEGYVAVPSVTEGLATEFALFDEEGEVEVPALVVEYKANGKVRRDRLDQVVKLAQWGVYNQEKEQRTQQIEQRATEVERELQQYAEALQQREKQLERLLTDEDFLYAVREAYEQENSPEKRAERAERELIDYRTQQEMSVIAQTGERFLQYEVEPAFQFIAEKLPSVSMQELEERFSYAMQAHLAKAPNGQPYIPESRYDEVRKYIVQDLATWAQMIHAMRSEPATDNKAQAELDRARVEAQKAKRAVGRVTKPAGQAQREAVKPNKTRAIATVDDAVESALEIALSSIR